MAGEHDTDPSKPSGAPPTAAAPVAGGTPAPVPEASRSADEKAHADWAGRPGDDGKTVKFGARDVDRPTDTPSEADGDAGGNLYERLARKDKTPVESGGGSGSPT